MELVGPGGPDPGPRRVAVTGRVEAGVEHGSVVLVADPGGPGCAVYQLGSLWRHVVGRRVHVVGTTDPGRLTTAQQGESLTVLSLTEEDART